MMGSYYNIVTYTRHALTCRKGVLVNESSSIHITAVPLASKEKHYIWKTPKQEGAYPLYISFGLQWCSWGIQTRLTGCKTSNMESGCMFCTLACQIVKMG